MFAGFYEDLKTSKGHFEITCPIATIKYRRKKHVGICDSLVKKLKIQLKLKILFTEVTACNPKLSVTYVKKSNF